MLHLSVSYKTLLRIAGLLLLLYGLYWVIRALFVQIDVGGSVEYSGPVVFWDAGEVLSYIFYGLPLLGNPTLGGFNAHFVPGPILYVGFGLLLLALSTRWPHVSYWGLQVAFWLGSMSCWGGLAMAFDTNGFDVPGSFTPFFWITLVCSLLLLAAYLPLLALLRKLNARLAVRPPQQQAEPEVLTIVNTQKVQPRD